jgi:[acyl-carrier-protein] S-malonyltransferase
MTIFGVFPGQGSQKPGMGKSLCESFSAASAVFDQVSEATGEDLRAICWESSEEELRDTYFAQLALFTCGVAAYLAAQEQVPVLKPSFLAGHSVGEYAALAAARAISVPDAARTVQARARAMKNAAARTEGTMAAIIGLDCEKVQQICQETDGIVVPANINSRQQVVISGETASVEVAMATAKESGAKMVTRLNVSGAFHSPLMEGASEELAKAMPTSFAEPTLPVFSNVTGRIETDPAAWRQLLVQQIVAPVQWAQISESALREGADIQVEFGTGGVLSGLMKRLAPEVGRYPVAEAEDLAKLANLEAQVS